LNIVSSYKKDQVMSLSYKTFDTNKIMIILVHKPTTNLYLLTHNIS